MNATKSTASALRELQARGLQADAYLQELARLADVNDLPGEDRNLDQAYRIIALRVRIAALKQRVRELEGRK